MGQNLKHIGFTWRLMSSQKHTQSPQYTIHTCWQPSHVEHRCWQISASTSVAKQASRQQIEAADGSAAQACHDMSLLTSDMAAAAGAAVMSLLPVSSNAGHSFERCICLGCLLMLCPMLCNSSARSDTDRWLQL